MLISSFRNIVSAFFLTAILLSSCRSSKMPESTSATLPVKEGTSSQEVVPNQVYTTKVDVVPTTVTESEQDPQASKLPQPKPELRSYTVEADVVATIDQTTLQGSAKISLFERDSIAMSATGPFGIPVSKMWASPKYMMYWDMMQSQAYEGNPENPKMKEQLPIPISANEIVSLLRAELPFNNESYKLLKTDTEKKILLYSYDASTDYVDFIQVSMDDATLLTYQRKSRSNEVLFNVNYSDYKPHKEIQFPMVISLQFPKRKTTTKFAITSIDINGKLPVFKFTIPKSVKKTVLD
jgi:hypothetical protein